MSEYTQFIKNSRIKSGDETHRLKILKAINTYNSVVSNTKLNQFKDWYEARKIASKIKKYVLENLPDLLLQFEKKATSNGIKVLWAENTEQAQKHFLTIANKRNAKKIVKSKSMTTEEIEFNECCESAGLEVVESDLGELIVQLNGEKPYHIVTPAMHKSKEEISKLFHEKLGSPLSDSTEELTMVAREHLRNTYITADIGVTGANFIIADEGAILMTENEGNGRLTMSCPPVHVVIVGIEKVIPRLSDLSLFLPLLATSGTGQRITGYNSIVRGPRRKDEPDGPEEMYVILLDNERSKLYAKKNFNEILKCIRCGACLNACPVYRTVGGHTYHTTYQGPVGSVITPHFKGMDQWNHLAYASSLCGSCTDVCPVEIKIHELLLENRWQAKQNKSTGKLWDLSLKIWAIIFSNRRLLNLSGKTTKLKIWFIKRVLPAGKSKRVPDFPKKSFSKLWREYDQQK